MTARKAPRLPRSPKAGRPPAPMALSAQARRREKSAHTAVRKDTTLFQTDDGPRVVWGVTKPRVKKR